ncbi:PhzF family phenazine biosynthesis protein [Algiphilus sp.]|uniref:PhzF family phenazine biosynthesis protein n=2 Tax=Algiphilus sp. TaxID=1872431 RepID=UPI0032ED5F7A
MRYPQFQVDAFADRVFAGNSAAVVPLSAWPHDALLQAIAHENQLSETAFFVPEGDDYALRWFTPTREVDLCGHATLATAHVLFTHLGCSSKQLRFHTRSGVLQVEREQGLLWMDFPAQPATPTAAPVALLQAIGQEPHAVLAASDWMVVLDDPAAVEALAPDFGLLQQLDRRGVIVTAPGAAPVDFVSRFFAPRYGIAEDAVTGSAHCTLGPYWRERLGKDSLLGEQRSQRGGRVQCRVGDTRVQLGGTAVTFLEGTIHVPGD